MQTHWHNAGMTSRWPPEGLSTVKDVGQHHFSHIPLHCKYVKAILLHLSQGRGEFKMTASHTTQHRHAKVCRPTLYIHYGTGDGTCPHTMQRCFQKASRERLNMRDQGERSLWQFVHSLLAQVKRTTKECN